MASWFTGGEPCPLPPSVDDGRGPCPWFMGGKRRVSHSEGSDHPDDYDHAHAHAHAHTHTPPFKRFRAAVANDVVPYPRPHDPPHDHIVEPPTRDSASVPGPGLPPFLILRERRSPSPSLSVSPETPTLDAVAPPASAATACAMERTASGLSISSDTSIYTTSTHDDANLLEDDEAAWYVEQRLAAFSRRVKDSYYERILRGLIRPRSREAEFSIDNDALESIFLAANEIFFHNRLFQRVTWDWSHSSSAQYQNHIIGTTALRRCPIRGGFETLIVLSDPILNDKKYNRRLLISTFLHELIHSYLFICCGFKARNSGGHTPGFRRIAELIDQWAGPDTLHLRDMEADLDHFKEEEHVDAAPGRHAHAHAYVHAHGHGHGHGHGHAHSTRPIVLPDHYDYPTPYHRHDYLSPANRRSHPHYPHQQEFPGNQGRSQGQWDYCVYDRREHIPLSRSSTPGTPLPIDDDDRSHTTEIWDEERIRDPSRPVFTAEGVLVSRRQSPVRQQQQQQQQHYYPKDHGVFRHQEIYGGWEERTRALSLSPCSALKIYGSPYVE